MTDETKKTKVLLAAGDIGAIAINHGPWLAVVSSDDSLLSHGGGVSEALWSAAGIEPDESHLPLPLGTIHRTSAGQIDAVHLIHAVTIDADRWIGLDAVQLASLLDHLAKFLESAIQGQGSESSVRRRVLLPLLGAGVAGVHIQLVLGELGRLITKFPSTCEFVIATDVQFEIVKKGLGIGHGVGRLALEPGKGRSPRRQGGDGRTGRAGGGMGENKAFQPWRAQDLAERDQALKHSQGFFRQQRQVRSRGSINITETIPQEIGHKVPHVDRLVDILVGLEGQEAAEVESMLDALGYRGTRRLRVKEYCIREDPRDIAQRLGAFRLKQVLESEFLISGVDPKESLEDLSRRFLLACGFQEIPVPHGLDSACERLAVLRSRIVNCEPSERVGLVLQAAGRVERVAADFLRFICLYLFDAGPERHLDGVANYDGRPLAKTTLGMILQLLDHLAKDLDSRSELGLKALAPILRERPLVPKTGPRNESGQTLASMRNTFAHLTGDGNDVPSLDHARSFFDLAQELLEYWRQPGLRAYPNVIRIESVSIDVWNRRVIDAKSDSGTSEVIVCDHEVRPGGLYFMLPRSNPFRVDPVLVAFGRADQESSSTGSESE